VSDPPNMPPPDEEESEGKSVRELVKRSLSEDALAKDAPDLLAGVQRRLRRRSRGKFYADGWSTTQARATYVLMALATLLLVSLAYFALGPLAVR
jgi:hypothetical protein